jgi:hypothetical protein
MSLQGAAVCAVVALAFLLLIAPWLVRALLPPEAAAARVSGTIGPLTPEIALLQHAGTCEIETRSLDPSPST